MSDPADAAAYRVFISHRHLDKRVADSIRTNLVRWGLPEASIYQSSSVGGGPAAGENIKDNVQRNLAQSDLFLLIYTGRRQDWPLFELGIASASKIHIVVFQLSKTAPPMQQEARNIQINEADVVSFAKTFHVQPGFFPGKPAFDPTISPDVYRERGRQLYADLARATTPRRSWPRIFATLALLLCGIAAGGLAFRHYMPPAFPQLARLRAQAEANGHAYFIESMTFFVAIEKEHDGPCVDAAAHQGCTLLRTVRGSRVHVVHALTDSADERPLWKENPNSDWAVDSEVIPGNCKETYTGGSERRKEYQLSAVIPQNDACTIVTGYKFKFPWEKKTRLIMEGFSTGPQEANSEYTVPQHYLGELTMLLQSDSMPLAPVTAYRVKPSGSIEKSDVTVREGMKSGTRQTLSQRWTDLEPGETVGIVYSWRGTGENQ